MITANVIHRVFRVCYGKSEASAFVIDVDGREYIITAKHVLPTIPASATLGLFSNGGWTALPVNLVGHCEDDIDISVLSTDRNLVPPGLPLDANFDGLVYGQDAYFLGFPYGLVGKFMFGLQGYPLPFVKRATVSLFHGPVFFLDGHNNPGFSGGPVVFKQSLGSPFRVAGVISAYRFNEEPVYFKGVETDMSFKYNTGIVIAYGINAALNVIRANPIGVPLGDVTPGS